MTKRSNLRPAPTYITPNLVKRILEATASPPSMPAPVIPVPAAGDPPILRLVENDTSSTPPAPCNRPTDRMATSAGEEAESRSVVDTPAPPSRASGKRAIARRADRFVAQEQLLRIAFERGVALADVAIALGKSSSTMAGAAYRLGLAFGRRPILAEPISVDQLLALADPAIPLPTRRADVLREARKEKALADQRIRRAKEAAEKALRSPKIAARVPPAARLRPAPNNSPARAAHIIEEYDRSRLKVSLRIQRTRRTQVEIAKQRIVGGEAVGKHIGKSSGFVFQAAAKQLADEARRSCPLEQAKIVLRRRRVVYSMSVHGGDPNLYFVSGLGPNITAEQLIAEAERIAR